MLSQNMKNVVNFFGKGKKILSLEENECAAGEMAISQQKVR